MDALDIHKGKETILVEDYSPMTKIKKRDTDLINELTDIHYNL